MIRILPRTVVTLLLFGMVAAGVGLAADQATEPIPVDAHGLPLWVERAWTDFPVRIELDSTAALDRLLKQTPIESFNREQIGFRSDETNGRIVVFEPRVTEQEHAALIAAGYALVRLPDAQKSGRRAMEEEWNRRLSTPETPLKAATEILDYYPTYAEVAAMVAQLAIDYPAICRTFSWGTSVEGRDLMGVVISADVHNTAPEPEVRLSGTMHGDEPPGMVMMLNFAGYLAGNYGQPGFDDVTELVDGTEIHIMPLQNPDGYVAGRRNNARNADLNRNYPEPTGYFAQEIETLSYMAYSNAHHFIVSQNAHTGALLVNYPWDHTYVRAPDNDALIRLSLEYSTYNLPMYNGFYDQGITNGADWFITDGCQQDWTYHINNCMEVTTEIHLTKTPSASLLPGIWDDNRESLMHYAGAAHYGVNGVITDAQTGIPLNAVVTVAGNAKTAATDPAHGDYYKLLDDGLYDITVSADGYSPRSFTNVSVTWGSATVLDVALVADTSATESPRVQIARVEGWPNPFNAGATVRFSNSEPGMVQLGIYDLQGRLIRVLAAGTMKAGEHLEHWDGRDAAGRNLGSGVYFARMNAGAEEAITKLVLVK